MSSISPKTMENNSDWQPGLSYMSDGVSGDQDESAQEGQADDSRKRKRLTITTYVSSFQEDVLLMNLSSPKHIGSKTNLVSIGCFVCPGVVSYAEQEKLNATAQSPAAAGAPVIVASVSTGRGNDLGFDPDTAASSSRRSTGSKPCCSC